MSPLKSGSKKNVKTTKRKKGNAACPFFLGVRGYGKGVRIGDWQPPLYAACVCAVLCLYCTVRGGGTFPHNNNIEKQQQHSNRAVQCHPHRKKKLLMGTYGTLSGLERTPTRKTTPNILYSDASKKLLYVQDRKTRG